MSQAVLADAQYGIVRVFRPFSGFEDVYQGQPVSVPIAIPGILDPNAGKTGFVSNLLAGIPMPLGSRMKVWIPVIYQPASSGYPGLEAVRYDYRFIWRIRNLADFRSGRSAYHFPKQTPGTNDQLVIPSAAKSAIYESAAQSYPTNTSMAPTSLFENYDEVRQRVFIESFGVESVIPDSPLTPGGVRAAFQQGLEASDVGGNLTVSFNAIEMDCDGDELIVLVNRIFSSQSEDNTWDFSGVDSGFSGFYGTADGSRAAIRDMGIYFMTGSSP